MERMAVATEDEHVRDAAAGDGDALAALLERHGVGIAASLRIGRRWRSLVSPDDVMQVTYLEAFLRVGGFVVPASEGAAGPAFAAWLRRIAENNLKDAVKELSRAKRQPPGRRLEAPDDRSYADFVEMLAASTGTPSGAAAAREAGELVEGALERLPADYARALRLYELLGWSIREVAAEMSRSEGSVKMLLARARDRLREQLGSGSQFFSVWSTRAAGA